MKRILKLKEHHGTRYFDISTAAQLDAVALSVVKGRFGSDNPIYPDDPEDLEPVPALGFTAEDVEKMPESLRKEALGQLKYHADRVKSRAEAKKIYDLTKKAIAENDGKIAGKVLHLRSHYEDESYEIIKVEELY